MVHTTHILDFRVRDSFISHNVIWCLGVDAISFAGKLLCDHRIQLNMSAERQRANLLHRTIRFELMQSFNDFWIQMPWPTGCGVCAFWISVYHLQEFICFPSNCSDSARGPNDFSFFDHFSPACYRSRLFSVENENGNKFQVAMSAMRYDCTHHSNGKAQCITWNAVGRYSGREMSAFEASWLLRCSFDIPQKFTWINMQIGLLGECLVHAFGLYTSPNSFHDTKF